jgi:uncharacterized protein (UPF0332 family)
MFYAVLALFLYKDLAVKTSKHSGIITLFDKEIIRPGIIDKSYSKILHRMFNMRQEGDYKELVQIPIDEAKASIVNAKTFITEIKRVIGIDDSIKQ